MQKVEIRVRGQIDKGWSESMAGLSIRYINGDTLLTGPVRDQAALRGVICNLADLGLELVYVINSTVLKNVGEVKQMKSR